MSAFDTPGAGAGPVLDTSNLATKTGLSESVAPLAKSAELGVLAKAADVTQARTDILAAVAAAAGAGALVGEVRQFLQGQVPPGWQGFTDSVAYPSKGIILGLASTAPPTGSAGVVAYVNEGAAAGYWYLTGLALQRYDLDTAAPIGPSYAYAAGRSASGGAFVVAVGKYLCIGGGMTAGGTVLAELLRFDTETGAVLRLANLPRGLLSADAVALNDGRFLIWASTASGLTQTMAATGFWLYDPETNLTATEVLVSLPLLNVGTNIGVIGHNLAKLPSGAVMIIEGSDATTASAVAHTTRYSCVLTVSGNTITAGPAENTGASAAMTPVTLLSAASGVHFYYSGTVYRTYIEGTGWTAGTQTFPHKGGAYSAGAYATYSCTLPGGRGWVVSGYTGGTSNLSVLLLSANAPGRPLVYARKL
jgi:hypothetical protein